MNSKKCPKCDLVNFAPADVCKRCGNAFTGGYPDNNNQIEDAYEKQTDGVITRNQEIGLG